MVAKFTSLSGSEDVAQPMDDTWWSALLAEEDRYITSSRTRHHSQPSHSSPAQPKQNGEYPEISFLKPGGKVNWKRAQVFYVQDEVLHLRVLGVNRGGLLVTGKSVHGFVPVSHLVDVPNEISISERENLLKTYIGRLIPLKIIECEPKRGRLIFSQRAAMAGDGRRNHLLEHLQNGMHVTGIVTNLTKFGVFVDLGGVEGLAHISELSWGRIEHPAEVVHVGKEVEAVVLSFDKPTCRVALSLKRLFPNPWESAAERYFPGLVVDATITSVVPFGAFARLEEGLDGLIHASGMQLEQTDVRPADLLHEGQQVRARVLHVDAKHQRLGLSLVLDDEIE